jgi:hypothetical protein
LLRGPNIIKTKSLASKDHGDSKFKVTLSFLAQPIFHMGHLDPSSKKCIYMW